MINQEEIMKKTSSSKEVDLRNDFLGLFKECPIPEYELLDNLGLFTRRQVISKLLFFNELYKKIIDVHGVIVEFGVRWGRNLTLFESLRGLYEPYNLNRKIIGFDTFAGFPSIDDKDGRAKNIAQGAFGVTEGYEDYLRKIMNYHEQESPISHIKKYQIVKGDATTEIERFLKDNPETIIALAYFDFDLYKPTKKCLEAIKGHLTKGSILGFDELNVHSYPGETLAFKEVFGLDRFQIKRNQFSSVQSYVVVE